MEMEMDGVLVEPAPVGRLTYIINEWPAAWPQMQLKQQFLSL
jgi:hypothetical protein